VNKRPLVASLGALRKTVALIILTTVQAVIFGLASSTLAAVGTGNLQIGLTGTIVNPSTAPNQRFRNVYLNVQRVLVNASATASATGGGWVSIPLPLGTSSHDIKSTDLQVDLNNIQNIPQLLNMILVKATDYRFIQIDLDPARPGSIVPLCSPGGGGSLEGCTPYPIQLQNTTGQVEPISGTTVTLNGTASLIINLELTIESAPTTAGQNYVATVNVSQAPQQQLGTVSGNIAGGELIKPNIAKIDNLSVTAEVAGTNTFVASATPDQGGNYTLILPAAPNIADQSVGSLYDVYVSGGGVTYAAQRLPPLYPGNTIAQNFNVTPEQKLGTIAGSISDPCTGLAIAGANVQLLIPPATNTSLNCADSSQTAQCVSVATAATDNTGVFPLTGQVKIPGPFNNVPVPATGATPYALEISAPGYDTTYTNALPTIPPPGTTVLHGGLCGTTTPNAKCNFALTSGQITGAVSLTGAPSGNQAVLVEVFAEESGTNNVVAALSEPLLFKSTQAGPIPFSMTVPTLYSAFDFYATAFDLYQGQPDPYTGHTILTESGVTGFNNVVPTCGSVPLTMTFPETMNCTGHSSVSGSFVNPTSNTTAILSKNDVQLMPSGPGPVLQLGTNPSNPTYAFCAPGDSYTITRYDVTNPSPGATPSSTPTPVAGASEAIMLPTPVPTASAGVCPTTCFNPSPPAPSGTCPGVCNGQVASPL
jgi:hypothetical protein